MSNNERNFFEFAANKASQGWDIHIQDHLQPGSMNLVSHTVRLYAVDTRNDWTTAAAMEPTGFECARKQAAISKLTAKQVKDCVGNSLAQLSRKAPSKNCPETTQTMAMLAAAFADTKTFETVMAISGDLSGHWLYVIYHAMDSSIIGRPVHFKTRDGGFLSPANLFDIVRKVVHQDLAGPDLTSVAESLQKGGGPVLSESFLEGPLRGHTDWPRPNYRN